MKVQELKQWFVTKKNIFKFKGVCESLGIDAGVLWDFVNKGYVSKQSLPALLGFALEHGFKFQANQSGYRIEGDVCEIFVLEVVGEVGEMEYLESSCPFLISDAHKEYAENTKQKEGLPASKTRRVTRKVANS